ncbi:mucin-2-like [Ylistrum balloti]|uniref:mucin-2-like n=1 Tax=Ylistrum balloti TaxID=509963 RepID=UPI0029057E3C|nr:mucin-2-like [Ylistrum balloti]
MELREGSVKVQFRVRCDAVTSTDGQAFLFVIRSTVAVINNNPDRGRFGRYVVTVSTLIVISVNEITTTTPSTTTTIPTTAITPTTTITTTAPTSTIATPTTTNTTPTSTITTPTTTNTTTTSTIATPTTTNTTTTSTITTPTTTNTTPTSTITTATTTNTTPTSDITTPTTTNTTATSDITTPKTTNTPTSTITTPTTTNTTTTSTIATPTTTNTTTTSTITTPTTTNTTPTSTITTATTTNTTPSSTITTATTTNTTPTSTITTPTTTNTTPTSTITTPTTTNTTTTSTIVTPTTTKTTPTSTITTPTTTNTTTTSTITTQTTTKTTPTSTITTQTTTNTTPSSTITTQTTKNTTPTSTITTPTTTNTTPTSTITTQTTTNTTPTSTITTPTTTKTTPTSTITTPTTTNTTPTSTITTPTTTNTTPTSEITTPTTTNTTPTSTITTPTTTNTTPTSTITTPTTTNTTPTSTITTPTTTNTTPSSTITTQTTTNTTPTSTITTPTTTNTTPTSTITTQTTTNTTPTSTITTQTTTNTTPTSTITTPTTTNTTPSSTITTPPTTNTTPSSTITTPPTTNTTPSSTITTQTTTNTTPSSTITTQTTTNTTPSSTITTQTTTNTTITTSMPSATTVVLPVLVMDDVTAVVNEPARVECSVFNAGYWNNLTIVSTKDSITYKRGESEYIENGNNVTVFFDITLTDCTDAGIYTCKVDNAVEDTAEVHVTGKPENVTLELPRFLNEGQTTSAVCRVTGTVDMNIKLHVKKPASSTYYIHIGEITSTNQHGDCLLSYTATFDFVPSFVDNGTELKCVVENTVLGVTSESKTEVIYVVRGEVSFDSYEQTLEAGKVSPPLRCTASNSSLSSTMKILRHDGFDNTTVMITSNGNMVQFESTRIQNGAISWNGNDLALSFEIIKVSCEDESVYSCVVNNSVAILTSPSKTIHVERPPGIPVLKLDPHQTTIPNDPNAPTHKHTCSVDVGYPEGNIDIEILRKGDVMFQQLTSTDLNDVSTTPNTWECDDALRTVSFGINFHEDMEEALVRCVVTNSNGDIRTYSDNATIELVPDNICSNTGGDKVTAHPNNCHKHVDCNSDVLVVNDCQEKCFVSRGTYADCEDCDNVPCPPPTTTPPPSTTPTGPMLLTCNDISAYINDATSLQCQIKSSGFDAILLSHMSSTTTASDIVSLGQITKVSADVLSTDSVWVDLDLAYHTDGLMEYINVTIPKLVCAMDGMFYLNLTNGNSSSTTTSKINVLDIPRTSPTISLSFGSVVENGAQTFTCEGDIGTNQGTLTLEIFDKPSEQFIPTTSVNSPTDQKNGCMVTRTVTTTLFPSFSQNGTVARCSAFLNDTKKPKDVTLTSDNVTLLVIPFPDNPLDCSNYPTGSWYIPPVNIYPSKCDQYVWCASGTKVADKTCSPGQYFTNFTDSAQTCTADYESSFCAAYGETTKDVKQY